MKYHLLVGMLVSIVACSSKEGSGGNPSTGTGGSSSSSTGGDGGGTTQAGGSTGKSTGGMSSGGAKSSAGGSSAAGTNSSSTGGASESTGGASSQGGSGGTSNTGGGSAKGGSSGKGGSGGGATTGGASNGSDQSVLERNKNPSRDGHFIQPSLTRAKAANMARDTGFKATFKGAMWASPLYMENGPGGNGAFFAVTTGNDVFALDETTGSTLWTHNIGSSPTSNGVSCGNIHPLGILSTPVIDAAAGTIFVAGAVGTTSIARHEIHALSIADGSERDGWPVDVSQLSAGSLKFDPPPYNQRSALSLVNGVLYVAYGGHIGDCGAYHGWVTAVNTKDPTKIGSWASLGQGEGIWAAGGLASDGNGVFAITGNNTASVTDHSKSDTEQVFRLTGMAEIDRSSKNLYYPSAWRTMDQQDADFGATNPVYIKMPGANGAGYVVAISKDGHFIILDPANLGGMAGHLVDFVVATGSAMLIRTVPTAYTTEKGVHVAFAVDNTGAMHCPAGGPSGKVIMSVLVQPGSPPKPEVAWCAALTGTEITAPIATTTDGSGDPLVWYMSGDRLTAVDGDTGETVFASPTSDTCKVRRWTSPIAVKGRVVVGGDNQLCSWSAP